MKKDKPTELTREEVVARWRERAEEEHAELKAGQEEEKARLELLEQEFWRATNAIKEHDPFHLVIVPSDTGLLFSTKIITDKPTESITVERRIFMLIKTQQVIPFSAVQRVVVDYVLKTTAAGGGGTDYWRVTLDTGRKKVIIDEWVPYENMLALGKGN